MHKPARKQGRNIQLECYALAYTQACASLPTENKGASNPPVNFISRCGGIRIRISHDMNGQGGSAMKKQFLFLAILFTLAFGSISVSAQCDRNTSGPIKCGYFDEGYMDGVTDGNSNRSSDYRRYRSKFESKYENDYRTGYEAGYESVRPSTRWSFSQRNAYDSGYNIGQNDRRYSGQNRPAENNRGQYDQNIGLYFQQGYNDGFANRPRRYDVAAR